MTPAARLALYHREDRLIRDDWTSTDDKGRHLACLLAALSPEVAESKDPSDCPAEVLPPWMANLTPWIDDAPSEEAWPGIIDRYVALAQRWHVLTPEAWEVVRIDWLCDDVLPEALSRVTVDEWGVRYAVEQVRRALRGDGDLEEARKAAIRAAKAAEAEEAAKAAEASEAPEAYEAAKAAKAAETAEAAARAAEAAARAAEAAAIAAEWAACPAEAATAAADRLISAILTRLEAACAAGEATATR